jgi:PIN domain nuclease of toxin-antitoxin system
LSARARAAFAKADSGRWTIHVPALVLAEIVLLDERGRLRVSYRDLREQLSIRRGFPVEPLTGDDIDEARSLAAIGDPFDRLIAATAVRLSLPLITRDPVIARCDAVETYW